MPINIYRENPDGTHSIIKDDINYLLNVRPNDYMTPTQFKKLISINIDIYGDAFIYIEKDIITPKKLWVVDNTNAKLCNVNGIIWLDFYLNSKRFTVKYSEILHFTDINLNNFLTSGAILKGKSKLDVALSSVKNSKNTNKLLDKYYHSGNLNSGIMETAETLSKDAKDAMKRHWEDSYGGIDNAGIAILDSGLKITNNTLSFKDMCIVELAKLNVEEISRVFGVPLHMLSNLDKSSFSNIEQQSLDFYQTSMQGLFTGIEEELTYKLYPYDKDIFTKFDFRASMRSDDESRSKYYKEMAMLGVLSQNDIRRLENENPIEGGDTYRVRLDSIDCLIADQYQLNKTNKLKIKGGDTIE